MAANIPANPDLSIQGDHFSCTESCGIWIHEHPATVKVIKAVSFLGSLGVIIALPFIHGYMPLGATITLGVTAGLTLLVAKSARVGLDLIAPPHHDMRAHLYYPRQCEHGKIYYQGDVPILSIDVSDPYEGGKAHGLLCGEAINRLSKRFTFALQKLMGQPSAKQLPGVLAAIKKQIPENYINEMQGMVDGYAEWRQANWFKFPQKMTLDDALLFHLMPDSIHFQPLEAEQLVACTSIIAEERPGDGPSLVRNMDWPSLGLAGGYTMLIHRKRGEKFTVEVGPPGFVGTLTGMNQDNLALAMNVCPGNTTEISGMPAALYNRMILDECTSVDDVKTKKTSVTPLGPYHMTVVDPKAGLAVHWGQEAEREWQAGEHVATFNMEQRPDLWGGDMHHTWDRKTQTDAFFAERNGRPLEELQALPYVNNVITTHRVMIHPKTRSMRVGFDNAFAGRTPLREVKIQDLR